MVFIVGNPSSLYEDTSVNMGYNRNVPADPSTDRYSRRSYRKENVNKRAAAMSLLDLSSVIQDGVEDVDMVAAGAPQLSKQDREIS